jgi:hypothetical protein
MEPFNVYKLGQAGVNIDSTPLHSEDDEILRAQNAIRDPLGNDGGLRNRPGLIAFNTDTANGPVLGGVGVPIRNLFSGSRFFFIGRGTL